MIDIEKAKEEYIKAGCSPNALTILKKKSRQWAEELFSNIGQ